MWLRKKLLASVAGLLVASLAQADNLDFGLKKGTADLKSAGALAFGPDGVLFVADSQEQTVYALGTGDAKKADVKEIKSITIDEAISKALDTSADQILVNDMKVNPASGNVYLSVTRGKGKEGKPAIVALGADGKVSVLGMKDIPNASVKLKNAKSITSMAFFRGELFVAGLTDEKWASNLRSIPVPFKEANGGTSVEIYHGAHGALETRAPIQTFMAYEIAGQTNILASYVCTPLVKFPVEKLKPGEKVTGTTVAELGNRNRPLDILAYKKDGKEFALIANSARGVMKVNLEGIDKIEPINTRIADKAGLKYDTIKELDGTVQLDKLNETTAIVIRNVDKKLTLSSVTLP